MNKSVFNKLHEECGVFGVFLRGDKTGVLTPTYHALYALQHRGQESCGMAVNIGGDLRCCKDVGLVNEVFTRDVMEKLSDGCAAIGQCRHASSDTNNRDNAQPLLINNHKGPFALCHNGSLINAQMLREQMMKGGAIFHTTGDIEVIAQIVAQERLCSGSIEQAVVRAMERIEGAYSLLVMSPQKMIAARDPRGFRPLCMGDWNGDIVFASESCALDAIGAAFVRDVEPGEVVVVTREGIESLRASSECDSALCAFEFIYFARPDSRIDGSSVHTARLRAGSFLALEHPVQADVVVGVPDSGIDAAIGYSRQSGIPYGIGFIKNRYIGRTFIQPEQQQRVHSVRIKLNVVEATVKGKRVVLIDDSIVRGNTGAHIVSLLREAGAAQVHIRLTAPPFMYPCYFGTDTDSAENLIAAHHSIEEIGRMMDSDSLGFLNIDYVDKLAEHCKRGFCKGCFTGTYPMRTVCREDTHTAVMSQPLTGTS